MGLRRRCRDFALKTAGAGCVFRGHVHCTCGLSKCCPDLGMSFPSSICDRSWPIKPIVQTPAINLWISIAVSSSFPTSTTMSSSHRSGSYGLPPTRHGLPTSPVKTSATPDPHTAFSTLRTGEAKIAHRRASIVLIAMQTLTLDTGARCTTIGLAQCPAESLSMTAPPLRVWNHVLIKERSSQSCTTGLLQTRKRFVLPSYVPFILSRDTLTYLLSTIGPDGERKLQQLEFCGPQRNQGCKINYSWASFPRRWRIHGHRPSGLLFLS